MGTNQKQNDQQRNLDKAISAWRAVAIEKLKLVGLVYCKAPKNSTIIRDCCNYHIDFLPVPKLEDFYAKHKEDNIYVKENDSVDLCEQIIDTPKMSRKIKSTLPRSIKENTKEYYDGITVKYVPVVKHKKQSKKAIAKKVYAPTHINPDTPKSIGYTSRCRKDEPIILDPDVFYKSWRWKELRLIALDQCGRRCCSCGATPRPDNQVVLHVDHIKPLRIHPKLALDISNLQVLCEACNQGKSWYKSSDYRSDEQRNKLIDMKLSSIKVTETAIASMHDSFQQKER